MFGLQDFMSIHHNELWNFFLLIFYCDGKSFIHLEPIRNLNIFHYCMLGLKNLSINSLQALLFLFDRIVFHVISLVSLNISSSRLPSSSADFPSIKVMIRQKFFLSLHCETWAWVKFHILLHEFTANWLRKFNNALINKTVIARCWDCLQQEIPFCIVGIFVVD